jgi:DNA-binding transcriptional LysR family regulator
VSTYQLWTFHSEKMDDRSMDPRRLALLLELSRHGSMREVAETTGVATSTVSQQLAVLAREAGTTLIEPDGRRVRLTPAGKRLASHAVTILAAIEAARVDLDPTSAPAGAVRVAAFATAARDGLLPVAHFLRESNSHVRLLIHEHEPEEALGLLSADDVDLALTYDYNLAPYTFDRSVTTRALWTSSWSLGVPTDEDRSAGKAVANFGQFRDRDWIVNSRNNADADVVRVLASMAGFLPRIAHRADSLGLVQDMIAAGLGVGLLPAAQPTGEGVALLALQEPDVVLRAYAVTRRGRADWPPLALVLRLLSEDHPARA